MVGVGRDGLSGASGRQDRFVFEHGGFRFIGMHQGPLMKMGDGYWAPQDVRWLEETLKKLPERSAHHLHHALPH